MEGLLWVIQLLGISSEGGLMQNASAEFQTLQIK
jgi:hypothetical protein